MKETFKQRLRERQHRQEMQETGGMPQSASFHRSAYHRNFQGYTEVKRLDANGRQIIERIYTGKYYEPALDRVRLLRLRIVYVFFFLASVALFLFCATRKVICNTVIYVVVPQGLSVILLLWCLYVLIFYLPAKARLTIGDYDTLHKLLIRSSFLSACSLWVCALACLICFFLSPELRSAKDLLCAAGSALSRFPSDSMKSCGLSRSIM